MGSINFRQLKNYSQFIYLYHQHPHSHPAKLLPHPFHPSYSNTTPQRPVRNAGDLISIIPPGHNTCIFRSIFPSQQKLAMLSICCRCFVFQLSDFAGQSFWGILKLTLTVIQLVPRAHLEPQQLYRCLLLTICIKQRCFYCGVVFIHHPVHPLMSVQCCKFWIAWFHIFRHDLQEQDISPECALDDLNS